MQVFLAADTVMPQMGVSGKETDETPSVFWMTNPMNHWEGNIAAGSQGYGFWMQLRSSPRGPHKETSIIPNQMPLGSFRENAAHSINIQALKISDYRPAQFEILDSFTSYLNSEGTFHIVSSENLALEHVLLDTPLHESYQLRISRTTVKEIRGCNNATVVWEEDADVNHADDYVLPISPSPRSVFNLEESF